jgi:hypothetical protein
MNTSVGLKVKVLPPLSAQLKPDRYKWLSLEMAEPNLGVPPIANFYSSTRTFQYYLTSNPLGERGWARADSLTVAFSSLERPEFDTIVEPINEILYKKPQLLYFYLSSIPFGAQPSILFVEAGTTLAPATLSWAATKVNPRAMTTWILNVSGSGEGISKFRWIYGGFDFNTYTLESVSGNLNTSKFYYLTGIDWTVTDSSDPITVEDDIDFDPEGMVDSTYEVKFVGRIMYGKIGTLNPTGAQIWANQDRIKLSDNPSFAYSDTFNGEFVFCAVPTGTRLPGLFVNNFTVTPVVRTGLTVINDDVTPPTEITYDVIITSRQQIGTYTINFT